jgi:NADPH-dependent ferric siderophore reductase
MNEVDAIPTFVTEVVRTEHLTPCTVRVTFGGGDLAEFQPLAPDQFVYVLLPPPGHDELTVDRSFTWSGYFEMPEEERPVGAYYTVRSWRPEAHEIDCDFVLHGDVGTGGTWATTATPGAPVALWGPRTSYQPPAEVQWQLLVADHTALPATAAILESLSPRARAHAVIEVPDEAEEQDLATDGDVQVTWLHRDGDEPGRTTNLLDVVRTLEIPVEGTYVWGGAESRTITGVRKHVRRARGLAREQVSLVGYWRHAAHPVEEDEAEHE